jgi:hypothetical protein
VWRTRSFLFAQALVDDELREEYLPKNETSENMNKYKQDAVPEHPFSLMEGVSGEICLLSDLLGNEDNARFPGFEI